MQVNITGFFLLIQIVKELFAIIAPSNIANSFLVSGDFDVSYAVNLFQPQKINRGFFAHSCH